MNDRAVSVFENYEIEILRTLKGRGALLCETQEGWFILKEYTGPLARLEIQEKLLAAVKDNGFSQLEQLIRNKEGGLISYDQDRVPYILKTYYEGRECNLKDVRECQSAARTLGRLHNAMHLPELVQEYDVPALCMENEYVKHNRELKKVRRYLREKGQKTEFEIYLLHHYDFFYEKALSAVEELQGYADAFDEAAIKKNGNFCHGDFQYHNLLFTQGNFSVINFEKYMLDNPVRDLYLFLRKLLEKNSWSVSLGLNILTAYETQRTLSEADRIQLYYRFAYPEKFWKIVNFYYNNGKAWIPGRNREKLENLLRQETEKKAFLDNALK